MPFPRLAGEFKSSWDGVAGVFYGFRYQAKPSLLFLSPKTISTMAKMKCPCKYIYDPEKGDPKQGIPPGTQFEDLPDTWRCPRCKRKKEKFNKA